MKYRVESVRRTLMPDVYDKDVDRRALEVSFTDNKHLIKVRYMVLADNYNIATQITDGTDDYWGAEVDYYGYKHKPTIKNWGEFDKMAQDYIDNNLIDNITEE